MPPTVAARAVGSDGPLCSSRSNLGELKAAPARPRVGPRSPHEVGMQARAKVAARYLAASPSAALLFGSRNQNRLPTPSWLSTPTLPP